MDLLEAKEKGFDPGVRHPWEAARVDVIGRLIRRHVTLERGATVMDIGCGDTFVVEQLALRYPDATFYAIDTAFTDELVEHYRTHLNNPRILPLSSLEAMPPVKKPASLVLLMDVLEHIEDDSGFLTSLRKASYIGPDTTFLVTVPAFQVLFSSHDTFLGHHRRYSNRTLRTHLEASGFRVIEIGYFFFSLLPIRVLQVLAERLFPVESGRASSALVGWSGGTTKAAILRRMLALDGRASLLLGRIGIKIAGLSNYAICAKSA